MSLYWQIPRNCLAWILIAQLLLIVPHVERLPWWVLVVYGCCAVWRVMVYQGRWSYPARSIRLILALLSVLGIYQSYGSLIGIEPTVALLFSGFCLKLLELARKRDVYVLIFLAYFVALTEFLFSQQFTIVLLILFTLIVISTALIALHQHSYDRINGASFKKAALIVFQALPLMLVLFIIFPRFNPLWKVPLPSHQAQTGINDTLSPGDLSSLSQSGELAFRVEFEDEVPSRKDLYWRGLVLSQFDGRTWTQGRLIKALFKQQQSDTIFEQFKSPLRYSIIQEASHQPWLFTLPLAYSFDDNVKMVNDYRLVYNGDIHSRIKYSVLSDPHALIQQSISPLLTSIESRLPANTDPQSRQLAKQLLEEVDSDAEYIDRVLSMFSIQEFIYTLKPPLLGANSIDDFLFNTRKGFCSHYASSFVFLMRAAGIPARVIVGYQGGEINPITGTVLVHQFDAHSWAEVWQPNKGWVRVDPTAAVSPNRIEYGLENSLKEEGSFLSDTPLSPLRYRNVAWLNNLRLQLDAFSYYWSDWVLNYKGDRQLKVMQGLLGELSPLRIALFIFSVGALLFAFIAYDLLKGRGEKASLPEVKLYLDLCSALEKVGFTRRSNEGAIEFSQRVANQAPHWQHQLNSFTDLFVHLTYQTTSVDQYNKLFKQMRSASIKLKRSLAKGSK